MRTKPTKTKKHPLIDSKIKDTYVKGSTATNKISLYDMYVKFFRFATDRLGGEDGVVCFVSNNSFLESVAFDGFRKELQKDFQRIYHLDLGGNARKGKSGNVFGIQVGVGITLLVKNKKYLDSHIYYYQLEDSFNLWDKLEFLEKKESFFTLREEGLLRKLKPNEKGNWFSEKLGEGFDEFLSLGTGKVGKPKEPSYFHLYSRGVITNRDRIVYDFDKERLKEKVYLLMKAYNEHVNRWTSLPKKEKDETNIDYWVDNENPDLKWDSALKKFLNSKRELSYHESCIRESLYRPFVKKYLYFDRGINNSVHLFHKIFPKIESENLLICVSGKGNRKSFGAFITDLIAEVYIFEATQCFPYYRYDLEGNRVENLSNHALNLVREKYADISIQKWDIFYYLYALLQHSEYRSRYQENLRLELPRVPLLRTLKGFWNLSELGRRLADLHLNYETGEKLKLEPKMRQMPIDYKVESMSLSKDKSYLIYNDTLAFPSMPAEVFEYKIANRSPIEWLIAYYKNWSPPVDNPTYLIGLIQRVAYVSVESHKLIQRISRVRLSF